MQLYFKQNTRFAKRGVSQKLNNYLAGNPRILAEKALNGVLQKLQNGLKNLAIYVAIKPMSITSKPRITKPNNI